MKIRGVYKMLYMDDKVLDMQLPFVRPGKDTTWMYVDERWRGNEEAVHVKDKVYAPYTTHATTLLKMTKRPPIWVMPTFKL
ncbi:hypothetical protein M0R45_036520 [Rubus argutus]|uniref:Uncharacterized protein n=1 Tax=Rubus argutus TaxID=59490 RepID=A0AAW1VWB0_RUBAR